MKHKVQQIHLGFEIGTGNTVPVPLGHLAVTGQTQLSGKTTTLEALISRSQGTKAIAFVTKRAEAAFSHYTIGFHKLAPYFLNRSDWQFVSDILGATLHEKLKFQRSWIMKVCRGTGALQQVRERVAQELATARRGLDQSVYTELQAYLDLVIPEIERLPYTQTLDLRPGLNVMDLSEYSTSLQMLVISSVLQRVYERESGVVTIIPEAWEFVPQKRGSPVMRAAEQLIRKSAAAGNYVWLDSQDLAGVHKDILKHCGIWILGVQREENEVQRTLKNVYTGGGPRPSADDIRGLGKGEFFVCHGREMKRVYVQPAWLGEDQARNVAVKKTAISDNFAALTLVPESIPEPDCLPRKETPSMSKTWFFYFCDSCKTNAVTDREWSLTPASPARTRFQPGPSCFHCGGSFELRFERSAEELTTTLAALGRETFPPGAAADSTPPAAAASPADVCKERPTDVSDEFFWAIITRLRQEYGDGALKSTVLQVAQALPEIRVEVKKMVVPIDGQTLRGRLARLIADGFFRENATGNAAFNELKRRGVATAKPNVYRELDKLSEMGFLFKSNDGYQATPNMKVTVTSVEVE